MSVTLRLSKTGKRNAPSYRLVASTTRNKRDGKYLEIIGFYNPSDPKSKFTYDKEKLDKWIKNGALTTKAVDKLLDGSYEFIKYVPKKEEKKEDEESEQVKTEESKE